MIWKTCHGMFFHNFYYQNYHHDHNFHFNHHYYHLSVGTWFCKTCAKTLFLTLEKGPTCPTSAEGVKVIWSMCKKDVLIDFSKGDLAPHSLIHSSLLKKHGKCDSYLRNLKLSLTHCLAYIEVNRYKNRPYRVSKI